MSTGTIKVENLSKSYFIGHERHEQHNSLRDVITNNVKGFIKNTGSMLRGNQLLGNESVEEFYALKNLNFEVNKGDRLGIIGKNGAGKSTLLKILSRITEPTQGKVIINGRVASLLEVGTGFHPELSGRENIFLNGAILGMSRNEVKNKFDEIVDFAEVEKFLDTPVKRYSSGMYVRLAFAVAAHLEPEILIVDEVLAVGDAQFQKKCLGKLEDVSYNEGRTVIFVSHNMDVVNQLCDRAILLSGGVIVNSGPSNKIVSTYLESLVKKQNKDKAQSVEDYRRNQRQKGVIIDSMSVNETIDLIPQIKSGSDISVELNLKQEAEFRPGEKFVINIILKDSNSNLVSTFSSKDYGLVFDSNETNKAIHFKFTNHFKEGLYRSTIGVSPLNGSLSYDVIEDIPLFNSIGSVHSFWPSRPKGLVDYLKIEWEI